MDKARSGTFGRPSQKKVRKEDLPHQVQEMLGDLHAQNDIDWSMAVDKPYGQLWFVAKLWEDEHHYTVLAAKVEYESESEEA